jgi:hypothetical protein
MPQATVCGSSVEFFSQSLLAETAAVVSKQELDGPPRTWVWDRAAIRACGDYAVDQGHRLVVERHHPFGVELAKRDLQPGAIALQLMDAVELEIEQLTDAQATTALE